MIEDVADPAGQRLALGDLETTGGHRRRADTDARGHERRLRVVGHGVLVHSDTGTAKGGVGLLAGQALPDQAEQEQVIVSAAGDHLIAALDEHLCHGLGVVDDLLLIGLEFRLHGLLEAHRLGSDDVHQRAALGTGEDGRVELFLDVFVGLGQDQATAWAAQSLVRSGGHHVGEGNRVRVQTGSDQTGDVGHVDEQQRPDLVSDGAKAREIEGLGVGGKAGNDDLRLVFHGQTLDFVVIDQPGGSVQAILHGVVQLARGRHLGAVGQVTTMRQTHAENGVARIEQRQIDRTVGRRAGVWLDVGVIGAEQRLGAVDGELLDLVDVLAATVITLARITLGVLVGQAATLRLHHPLAAVVFRGDQLDVRFLALLFLIHCREQRVIVTLNLILLAEHLDSPAAPVGGGLERAGQRDPVQRW